MRRRLDLSIGWPESCIRSDHLLCGLHEWLVCCGGSCRRLCGQLLARRAVVRRLLCSVLRLMVVVLLLQWRPHPHFQRLLQSALLMQEVT